MADPLDKLASAIADGMAKNMENETIKKLKFTPTPLTDREFASKFQNDVQQSHVDTASGRGLDAIGKKHGIKRDLERVEYRGGGRYFDPETDVELRERIKEAQEHGR